MASLQSLRSHFDRRMRELSVLVGVVRPWMRESGAHCPVPRQAGLCCHTDRNLLNVDNCDSIVNAQRLRYPMLTWVVGDVRRLPFEDRSFDAILDKGCLDNLLCYVEAQVAVDEFLREMRRLLANSMSRFALVSRLITHSPPLLDQVSCHDNASIRAALSSADWQIANAEVPNPRWPEIRLRSYQVALCALSDVNGDLYSQLHAGLSKTRLRPATAKNDADVAHTQAAKPHRNSPIPTRLHHLESRASGRRHFELIATSVPQRALEPDSRM